MRRCFLLTLQFDGSEFLGWQRQKTGRTVQDEVEQVLARLTGARVPAHAAGRTDAGVHAQGLAVSCSMPATWTPKTVRRAMNALLPRDCWVATVHEMRDGFHARTKATSRRYNYVIGCDEAAASPFRRRYEWALGRELDQSALDACAATIVGQHDFSSFAAKGEPRPHYLCRLAEASWEARPERRGFRFVVEADRFLQHMVRMLVGTMVDIALGRRPQSDMRRLLDRRDNQETSPPAPPQGLYFIRAAYPAEWYVDRTPEAAGAIA